MSNKKENYSLEAIPKMRRFSLDAGYLGRRRHIVHGLIEVDITETRNFIRAHKEDTGESLSLTAFIIYCLAVCRRDPNFYNKIILKGEKCDRNRQN